jgi:perosamine synthetase
LAGILPEWTRYGGVYKGRKLGTWADIGCFSFQEKKVLATGDGGMICSDDSELIEPLRAIKEVGMTTDTYARYQQQQVGTKANPMHWYYEVRELGYKYNMCDVIAAIGLAQLEKIEYMNKSRIEAMAKLLQGIKECRYVKPAFPYDMSTPYYDFMVRAKTKEIRDKLIVHMQHRGIATGVHTMPVPYLPYYRKFNAEVPTAMCIWEQYVVLPFFVSLSDEEIEYVVDAIIEFDEKNAS